MTMTGLPFHGVIREISWDTSRNTNYESRRLELWTMTFGNLDHSHS